VSVDHIQIQDARELALSVIMSVKMGKNHLLAKPDPGYEFGRRYDTQGVPL
jgi:hypothetical protein